MAGDWLAQGPGTHGAKGLSQEKAYVTGLQAGNEVRLLPLQLTHACLFKLHEHGLCLLVCVDTCCAWKAARLS